MRVARWRNRNQEVHHASQISGNKGRRCCSPPSAKDESERQGRIAQTQIDEEKQLDGCLDQAQSKPEHARSRARKVASRSTARKSPARKHGAEDDGAQDIVRTSSR
jgi:hypothetical protein